MTCPNCGAEGQGGNFCSACGAGLEVSCPECGAEVPPGSRFCPACGARIGASSAAPKIRPVWWIAAAAALVVVLILLIPERADRAGPRPMTDPGAAAPMMGDRGGFGADMRTNADRLFTRVMTAAEAGDQAEVDQFMPMAIQAYQMAGDLDNDGLFHLAILHLTAGDYAAARATAHEILDRSPNHVLGLGVAGSAAERMGDEEAATAYYRRLIDTYGAEAGRPLPEYVDHQVMVEEYRRAASAYLAAR